MSKLVLLLFSMILQTIATQIFQSGDTKVFYELTTVTTGYDGIQFTLVTPNSGYFGIGFNGVNMNGVDTVICLYNAGTCQCKDYWSSAEVAPTLDSNQDTTTQTAQCTRSGSGTKYVFTRKLDTSDAVQDSVLVVGSATHFTWSIGSSDSLVEHTEKGTFTAILANQFELLNTAGVVRIQQSQIDPTKVQFIADIYTQGYFGLGYKTQTMGTSDITICNFMSGAPFCIDYTSNPHAAPTIDANQNIVTMVDESYSTGTGRHFVFMRQLNTGDTADAVLQFATPTDFIWSVGSDDTLIQHVNRGTFSAQLGSTATIDSLVNGGGGSGNPGSSSAYSDSDMPSSMTVNGDITLKWKFNDDGTTIDFAVIFSKKEWLGIGFGTNMINTDIFAAQIVNNAIEVKDYWATAEVTPALDSQQDITNVRFEIGTDNIKYRFTRKLDTGDAKDFKLTEGSTFDICYASTTGDSMREHTESQAGTVKVTLARSATDSNSDSKKNGAVIYGVLLILSILMVAY